MTCILKIEAKSYDRSTKDNILCNTYRKQYSPCVYPICHSVNMNTCCDHVNRCDKGRPNTINTLLKTKKYVKKSKCKQTPKNPKRILFYKPMIPQPTGHFDLADKYPKRKCINRTINPVHEPTVLTKILKIYHCSQYKINLSTDSLSSGKIKKYFKNASCCWLSTFTDTQCLKYSNSTPIIIKNG
jgi:hypothetical protein